MSIGPTQLLLVFLIVLVLFGTKRLRNAGGDLGSAIRGFRKAMNTEDEKPGVHQDNQTTTNAEPTTLNDKQDTRN